MFNLVDVKDPGKALFVCGTGRFSSFFTQAALRVSELAGATLADLSIGEAIIRVRGKGNKERIVPVGSKALSALGEYLDIRGKLKPVSDHIFLNSGEAG